MFKKSTSCRILYSIAVVVAILAVCSFFGVFAPKTTVGATTVQNSMNLASPTDISGATINFATPEGENNADFTGSPISIVKSITVGTDEVQNMNADQTTNYTVSYKRGGEASTDITSAGVLEVVVTGQNDYTGEVSTTFTINKTKVLVEFAPSDDLKIDDTAMQSLHNGSGLAVFLTSQSGQSVSVPQGLVVTYYNKTLNMATNGFTNSGEYLINVMLNSEDCQLVGKTYTEVYVKALVLENKDGTIRVENANGFEKGVSLGEATITTNKNAINARTDLKNKQNIKALVNLTFLKDGIPFILEDEVTIKIDAQNLDLENVVLQTNDYANSEFKNIDFEKDGEVISFKIESSAKDANSNDKTVGTNSFVLTTAGQVSVMSIVTFSLTGLAFLILIVLNIVMYCTGAKKRK